MTRMLGSATELPEFFQLFPLTEMAPPPLFFLAAYGTYTSTPILAAFAEELGAYGWWTRSTVREFLRFTGRTLAGKTPSGQYLALDLDKYDFKAYSYAREDGLVIVLIAASTYPATFAQHLLDLAASVYSDSRWMLERRDVTEPRAAYQQLMAKYQEPVDSLQRTREKIAEVKQVALITIDKLLARGEKIELLVADSNDLSETSKKFYRESQNANSCCWRWFGWRRH